MLHIAVILYDDTRMFSRINVKWELTCVLSKLCYIFVNNVWSGTGSTRQIKQTIEIKAPPKRVFALNPVQLCRQVCTLFLLNFINGGRKKEGCGWWPRAGCSLWLGSICVGTVMGGEVQVFRWSLISHSNTPTSKFVMWRTSQVEALLWFGIMGLNGSGWVWKCSHSCLLIKLFVFYFGWWDFENNPRLWPLETVLDTWYESLSPGSPPRWCRVLTSDYLDGTRLSQKHSSWRFTQVLKVASFVVECETGEPFLSSRLVHVNVYSSGVQLQPFWGEATPSWGLTPTLFLVGGFHRVAVVVHSRLVSLAPPRASSASPVTPSNMKHSEGDPLSAALSSASLATPVYRSAQVEGAARIMVHRLAHIKNDSFTA